jgi:pimeloyl-ACP methyl ester carboxylesterase
VKWRRWALALGAAAALGLVAAGGCGQSSLIFPAPPRGRQPAYPDQLVQLGDATFLYFHGSKVVVYFHGNGEDLADSIPMVSLLRTLGVGVLAVEYPGYGIAAGTPSEQGAYAAAERALRWLRTERGVDSDRVVLLGQSLGTGVAAEMARRGFGARVVLISPFTSVGDMARRMIPFFPARFVRHRFDTAAKAPAIAIPVLIIHGTEDEVVPFAMGERLATVFPQARFVPVQGGRHNDLLTLHALAVREALAPFVRF